TNTDKEFFEWHEAQLLDMVRRQIAERVEQSNRSKAEMWLHTRAEAQRRAVADRERFRYQSQYGETLLFRTLGLAASFGMCFIVLPSLYGFILWMASGN